MQVGKLDVANVSKAIHRYGTIPKGVRIGAFLQSLESGTITPSMGSSNNVDDNCSTCKGKRKTTGNSKPSLQGRSQFPEKDATSNSTSLNFSKSPSSDGCHLTIVKSLPKHEIAENSTVSGMSASKATIPGIQTKPSKFGPEVICYEAPWGDLFGGRNHPTSPSNEGQHLQVGGASDRDKDWSKVKPKPNPRFSRLFGDGGLDNVSTVTTKTSAEFAGNGLSGTSTALLHPIEERLHQHGHSYQSAIASTANPVGNSKCAPSNILSFFKTFGKSSEEGSMDQSKVSTDAAVTNEQSTLLVTCPSNFTTTDQPASSAAVHDSVTVTAAMSSAVASLSSCNSEDRYILPGIKAGELVSVGLIAGASDHLQGSIDRLSVAGNKTSTNFMMLSDEVSVC